MGEPQPPAGPRTRVPLAAAAIALAVLLASTDERSFGVIPDGQEMLSAAASVARFLEIGISRDFANAPPRAAGDAVSRYGMGLSLLEAVPVTAARLLSGAVPRAPATPLFALVPILCLSASAYAFARTLLLLGASPRAAVLLGLALPFATPLWGYAGSDYSEPLQAVLLALLALSVTAIRSGAPGARSWQVAAGVSAGLAVLTKSVLLAAVLPLLAAGILGPPRDTGTPVRRSSRTPAGAARWAVTWPLVSPFAVLLLVWALLELARFGKLLGGYGGETFTYPFFTGLFRLTVLPNKGLLLYAPLVLLAPLGFLTLRRRDSVLALSLLASALIVLCTAAAWWAWDGQAGWGPRLLIPALPALVLLAAVGILEGGRAARAAGTGLAVLGLLVNALGALVPFPQVYALAAAVPPQPITEARAEGTPYEIYRGPGGELLATGPHHLSLTPAWFPPRVHALVLAQKIRGGDSPARGDFDPPFVPAPPADPGPSFTAAVSRFRWPFWGRSFSAPQPGLVDPYRRALRDQLVRAIDIADLARAAGLGRELVAGAAPDAFDLALAAEAALRGGQSEEADLFLARSPEPCHPWINFVRHERGGDLSCIPEPTRTGFLRGLEAARAARLPLTGWARAALRARPGT